MIAPFAAEAPCSMSFTMDRESDATTILERERFCAKAKPSQQASDSRVDGSSMPSTTIADVPRYSPDYDLHMAAAAPLLPLRLKPPSTLIFALPSAGGSHRFVLSCHDPPFLAYGLRVFP